MNDKPLREPTEAEDRLFTNLAATWSSGAMFTPDSHIKILREYVEEQIRARIESLERELADLRKQSEWRTMDTAPRDGTEILGLCSRDVVEIVHWREGIRHWENNRDLQERVTSWMPLPAVRTP